MLPYKKGKKMHVVIQFDENYSAQKALEIVAKNYGGRVSFVGKTKEADKNRIFVKIEMPEESELGGFSTHFRQRSIAYLESLGLNPYIGP